MVGKNKLKVEFSCISNLRSVCEDFHTFVYGGYTGSYKCTSAFNFYKAETASADLVDILQIAESGNVDPGFSGGLQHGGAFCNGIFLAVDLNGLCENLDIAVHGCCCCGLCLNICVL